MQEKTSENDLEALNTAIAQLREEIAALTAYVKQPAEWRIDQASVDGESLLEGLADGDKNGGWTGFRHKLGEAGARGEKVAEGLAHEIERHPLIGGMIAFGLGFFIARLLFRRSKIEEHPTSF